MDDRPEELHYSTMYPNSNINSVEHLTMNAPFEGQVNESPEVLRRSPNKNHNRSAKRMTPYGRPTKLPEGVPPPQNGNLKTEKQRELDQRLFNQLNTNLTIEEQFARHRLFVPTQCLANVSEDLSGQLSSSNVMIRESNHSKRDRLLQKSSSRSRTEPCTLQQQQQWDLGRDRMMLTRNKIGRQDYRKVESFSFADRQIDILQQYSICTQRRLEAENAQRRKMQDDVVMKKARAVYLHEHPVNRLKDLGHKQLNMVCAGDYENEEVYDIPVNQNEISGDSNEHSEKDLMAADSLLLLGSLVKFEQDPVVRTYVAPIPEEDIKNNRLTLEEILQLPRFKDYDQGVPGKVLFLKNLSNDVTETDLISLFSRYENNPDELLKYRLMTGRMKGQAFITFNNMTSAAMAMCLTNGFNLKGKPMIIQYGNKSIEDN